LRRPNLSQNGGFAEVADILAKRTPIYEGLSDITIAVEGKTPDEICDEIADCINSANAQ
jgi:shikimate kinase